MTVNKSMKLMSLQKESSFESELIDKSSNDGNKEECLDDSEKTEDTGSLEFPGLGSSSNHSNEVPASSSSKPRKPRKSSLSSWLQHGCDAFEEGERGGGPPPRTSSAPKPSRSSPEELPIQPVSTKKKSRSAISSWMQHGCDAFEEGERGGGPPPHTGSAPKPNRSVTEEVPPQTSSKSRKSNRSSISSWMQYGCDAFEEGEKGGGPPPRSARTPRRSSLKGSRSSTPKGAPRRHSLTFSKDVVVSTIVPTKKLAKKNSLWFMEKDYEKMRKKISHIAKRAQEKGGAEHKKKYCTRGLENLIRQGGSETRRYAAWDAVMDEQANQCSAEYYNEDAVSKSYRTACEESRAEATIRALQDEKEVAEYLSDTRNSYRRGSA
ncbi:unnamed protein product [Cylindrotheca closterium]|uniref:Uncharacterized protein n=1 Tax=Cylindrotheca closterium TaxID=2856 RepID=A0AAD2FY77_9STRA|nr:unnamed protein product [Cylindrotheca closterium]